MSHEGTSSRTQLSMDLEAYWRSLPRTGKVPAHPLFDLLDIPHLLSNVIIIEVNTEMPGVMKVTFSGSTINERSGTDITGIDYRELYPSPAHSALWQSALTMVEHPCGHYQYTEVQYENAESGITEGTSFPVSGRSPNHHFIVGTTEWVGFALSGRLGKAAQVTNTISRQWIDIGFGVP